MNGILEYEELDQPYSVCKFKKYWVDLIYSENFTHFQSRILNSMATELYKLFLS